LKVSRAAPLLSGVSYRKARPLSGDVALDCRDFGAIYNHTYEDVVRWIRWLGAPLAEQDDLIQDVFLVVHRRLPGFDGENLAAWLYRITERRVRDFRRLAWVRHACGNDPFAVEKLESTAPTPAAVAETSERRRELTRLLSKLSSRLRATFILFEIDGYTAEEIAEIQGISANTARARIQRARKKLAARIRAARRRQVSESQPALTSSSASRHA
jgi:RNA polymerase sigma-70 factor (ECF subfamily)